MKRKKLTPGRVSGISSYTRESAFSVDVVKMRILPEAIFFCNKISGFKNLSQTGIPALLGSLPKWWPEYFFSKPGAHSSAFQKMLTFTFGFTKLKTLSTDFDK